MTESNPRPQLRRKDASYQKASTAMIFADCKVCVCVLCAGCGSVRVRGEERDEHQRGQCGRGRLPQHGPG